MASDANARERQQALFEKMYLHKRFRVTHGPNAPETLDAADDLVVALLAVGRPYAAHGLAHKTLRRSKRVLGDDHPGTLACERNLSALPRARR